MSAPAYNVGGRAGEFYLPLLSDSSGSVFPDNKLSHFHVQLETPLFLEGDWECGLAQVLWPPSDPLQRQKRGLENNFAHTLPPPRRGRPGLSSRPPLGEDARVEERNQDASSPTADAAHAGRGGSSESAVGSVRKEKQEEKKRSKRSFSAREGMQGPAQEASPPKYWEEEVEVADVEEVDEAEEKNPATAAPAGSAVAEEQPTPPPPSDSQPMEVNEADNPATATPAESAMPAESAVAEEQPRPPPPSSDNFLGVPSYLDRHPLLTSASPAAAVAAASVPEGSRVFVYCDLIRPFLCSDFKGKCIRIIPMEHSTLNVNLFPVYYYAVEKKVIDTIHVEIMDKYGSYLNFPPSKHPLVLVLHFKRAAVTQ